MTFKVQKGSDNLSTLVRQIGYRALAYTPKGELNAIRPLGGDYPRFHLYIKEEPQDLIFNLHLDQKKPVYEGATAHSGDYDGEVVVQEAERIKGIII